MPISVSYCLFSQPLLVVIGFYSHEQWLYLFGSFQPWLSRPTYIYGAGDNLFYAYPCMSVQSFHHLFMRGPMHSALAVMHCFLGTWPFSLFHPVDEPDLRRTCIAAPPQLQPKI